MPCRNAWERIAALHSTLKPWEVNCAVEQDMIRAQPSVCLTTLTNLMNNLTNLNLTQPSLNQLDQNNLS